MFDAETYAAAVSTAKKYTDEHGGGGVSYLSVVDGKICVIFDEEDDDE